jgi:putative MATE family efflux protein
VRDLTEGDIRGHVWSMALFMLVSMLVQILYNLVDLYFVSRLGKEAIAAVSIGGNLMMVVMALGQMLAVGAAALISHAAGRKDVARVQFLFNQAMCLSAAMAAVFLVVGLALRGVYSDFLSGDAQTALASRQFLVWYVPAMALQLALMALGAALRGLGSMRPAMLAQVGTVFLNIVLAPILIFGWGTGVALGVAGAGLATFLSMVAGTIGLAWYLGRKQTYLRVNLADWRPVLADWRRMLAIGLPSGAEFALLTVYLVFIFALIRPFGAEAQAGFGIGMRIMQSGVMPAMAVSFAAAAVAGQNYGAGLFPRVRETFVSSAIIASSMMLLFAALCHFVPAAMMGFFSTDAAVIQVGEDYLRIVSWNYLAFGIAATAGGIFQGLGNTWPSLISSAIRMGLVVLPAWWLSRQPGFRIDQLWWLSVGSVWLQMVLCLLFLRREFSRKLGGPPEPAAAVEPAT